jgi:TonB family protein
MSQKILFNKVSLSIAVLLSGAFQAKAQVEASETNASTSSIRLPQMVGGGGDAAIVRAIQRAVKYPRQALRDGAQGQSMVTFAVAPNGQVCLLKMKYGIRADLDSAVIQAVRQLPRLQPATQHGQPVACLMSAPVTFTITNPARLPRQPLPALDSTRIYSDVTRMPSYRGQPGLQQVSVDLTAGYVSLTQGTACGVPRYGRTIMATLGPSGTLYDVQLAASDAEQIRSLEARFGNQVIKTESPDEEAELADDCVAKLVEVVRHLPRLTPAYVAGRPVAMRLLLSLSNPQP